jgi:eukaryotic-like serine/threonine-protein kinase
MTIAARTRFGPYEIGVPLGAGGMGEVYRARDTRLDRDVAIKVLPPSLAQNEQFRLRFEREAKTISQLNHPHICTLHDIGAQDGVSYLVMELVDGESLADIIERGPLPARDVVKYGTQVAEALAAAHRAGVVHRDLKPANVMITKSGAKLLDFGLAKSNVVQFDADDATQQKPLTQEGTILGTFQYMAPEQLEGQDADARTDIFALGTLLYEMATGQRAFKGKTRTSLIAAIVKEQPPPMNDVQPLTPPALQHVVDRCLAKEPDDRWQSALDVAAELRWISSAGSQAGMASPLSGARFQRSRVMTSVALAGWLLAIAAIIGAFIVASRAQNARRVTQLQIADPVGESQEQPVAVSPDGLRVVMVAPNGGTLSLRQLDGGETRKLSGTENASYPFWAPDGHAVAFFVPGAMKVVDLVTGAVQRICDAPAGRGGAWGNNGVIVFTPDYRSGLSQVSENGGHSSALTKLGKDGSHRNPNFLPDGKHFLYCAVPDFDNDLSSKKSSVRIGSLGGGEDRQLLPYASNVAYVDGWLLSIRDRNLVAQKFDAAKMSLQGKPVAIAQNIEWYLGRWLGTFSAGGDTLVYRRALDPKRQLLLLDPGTGTTQSIGDLADYAFPAVSPDGRKIIVNRGDPAVQASDLWMMDAAGGNPVRLTFQAAGTVDDTALFSPDGQRIALVSTDEKGYLAAWIQPVGGGAKEMLRPETDGDFTSVTDWYGNAILMTPQRAAHGRDIELVRLDGKREPVSLKHGVANERSACISPNGKWMAYGSDESGREEIYVTDFPAVNAKWQVSTTGGSLPRWSADGGKLYYLTGNKIVSAAVHEAGSFSADPPNVVEALDDHITGFTTARNGRIVAIREVDSGVPQITVVLNWRKLLGE